MQDYNYFLNTIGEYGIVEEVRYPLIIISGLPHAKPNEIVIFEDGQQGEIFSIEKDSTEVLIFSQQQIKPGMKLVRTDQFLSMPVGTEFLGKIIDAIGRPITQDSDFKKPKLEREIQKEVEGIAKRARVKKPLLTGVTVVDMMIPLGCGQKQLVIGDRKTGKSSFLLSTIKNQVNEGTIVIYAAIARKKSEIKNIKEFFEKEKIMDKIVIIASSSHDSPNLIYITPYSAMTLAEYFADQGQDVLIVMDDLSTHAKYYREIALVGKRFPGRDSYPGDIFYTHAKLLERAGNFKHKDKGEVSITCLPVIETVEGDLSGYIATNTMGMTDGHIFFDINAYYNGKRPAINLALSVTRVGRQTQSNLKREITRELTAFLATYDRMQNYSHFGAELSGKIKSILKIGDKIYKFFDQHYKFIIPEEIQLIVFSLIWSNYFENKNDDEIDILRNKMTNAFNSNKNAKELIKEVVKVDSFYQLLTNIGNKKDQILKICETNI